MRGRTFMEGETELMKVRVQRGELGEVRGRDFNKKTREPWIAEHDPGQLVGLEPREDVSSYGWLRRKQGLLWKMSGTEWGKRLELRWGTKGGEDIGWGQVGESWAKGLKFGRNRQKAVWVLEYILEWKLRFLRLSTPLPSSNICGIH